MSVSSGFFPGDGVGIVTQGALILLEHAVGDVVPALLAEPDGIDAVLEVVAAAGLRAVGSFAIAVEEGEALRVIARGDAWVRISGDGETAIFDGAGLRTWNEQLVSGWDQVTLGLGERVDPPSLFEVERGVVPAGGLARPNVELVASAGPDEAGPVVVAEAREVEASSALIDESPVALSTELESVSLVPAASEAVVVAPHSIPADPPMPAESEPEGLDPAQTIVVDVLDDARVTLAPPAITSVPGSEPDAARNDYDDIFGRTVVRSVQAAAVHHTDGPDVVVLPTSAAAGESDPGDHDGHTITLARLRELQRAEADSPQPVRLGDHDGMTVSVAEVHKLRASSAPHDSGAPESSARVTVQALVCGSGHPNPTHVSVCGRCAAPLGSQPVTVPRPVLGRLVLSTREVVELDRSAIIGRNPRIEGRLVGELPKVVRLETFEGLSRSHAMVRLEGWQVLLVDLGSANHSTVTLPGRQPQRLHPDEPVLLSHGAFIDLGNGEVTATYESYS